MRRSHTHMCAGHLGFKKTAEQVQRRAYWVGWRRDVERFCRQCDECNRYHRGRLTKTAPLPPIVTGDVWELLSVDLTRPHPRTNRSQFDTAGTIAGYIDRRRDPKPFRSTTVSTARASSSRVQSYVRLPHRNRARCYRSAGQRNA